MEPNGNFVLYGTDSNLEPEVIWSTGTSENPGSKLVLEDGCFFVLGRR
jgi:hypothetical protein